MAKYSYKARSGSGQLVQGESEAQDENAVAMQLAGADLIPVEIELVKEKQDPLADFKQQWLVPKPTLDDLILFSRQMYTLMKAQVPILRAMSGLVETTRNPRLAGVIRELLTHIESGRELSVGMSRHPDIFSSLYISMVQVGEATGNLDQAFIQIARYLEQEKDTRNRVKTALRYPTFVIGAIAIAIGIINALVIPAFSKVYSGLQAELPLPTKILIASSNFTVTYWHWLLGGAVLGWLALRRYLQTPQGELRWDRLKLRLPLVGSIILRATLARFARAFAMSSRAGVPLLQALGAVSLAVDNAYLQDKINSMRTGIERGDTLTRTAAATGMFTPLTLQMLSVGEETGAVDDMMEEMAEFYEREVDYELKYLGDAIEPILTLAVGVLVLILALGVFLPMWDMSNVAR